METPDPKSQIPNPKLRSQPDPRQAPTLIVFLFCPALRLGLWDLGFGLWDFSD